MKSIACNLIYNNGDEGTYVGFKKRCDIQNIIFNVELDSKRWCSQPQCSCRMFYDRGFTGKVRDYPCTESYLFEGWEWNPGSVFVTGENFRILNTGADKYAILTTRFGKAKESERKIVGFLKIDDLVEDHYRVIGKKEQSLRLTLDEAHELNFWNYHKNQKSNVPMWRQGRFRYLEDNQVAAIMHDLKNVVQDESNKSLILSILESDFPEFSKTKPKVKGALQEDLIKKIRLKRKYGKGGESKEHKELKEYISKHPEEIGLKKSEVKAKVEHSFLSGDLVDILFYPTNGTINTVVEIELDVVEPGIHQAIKYRALRCSQLGLKLTDPSVKASIVAWKFKDSEIKLCNKYNIDYHKIKL